MDETGRRLHLAIPTPLAAIKVTLPIDQELTIAPEYQSRLTFEIDRYGYLRIHCVARDDMPTPTLVSHDEAS